MSKSIAVITARGGSKRIPRKNIKEFCGKPIIQYSIEAALASGLFDEVMVSTDDEEIAEIARKFGANVPFMRSEETSNDYAGTNDVLKEVFTEYEKRGQHFDIAVCIYPTAPFVTAKKLKEAVELMESEHADAVTPVVRFSFPPQRAFVIQENFLQYQFPEYASSRSQDLEPVYHDCGQFYVMRVDNVLNDVKIKKSLPLIVSELEVQDIDNEEDWQIAEMKYKIMVSENVK
ncbi:MAG: pseudaminic acid cytidylyltransferase [Lachnospiraceae bacterium]|nr:pseudaminic acid cytidylyltransferase [Lachnospiraceae bacterium]